MMMMMMNCFCGMVGQRISFSLISSRDHCQRSSPSRIFDAPRAGYEPVQNLTTPRRHIMEIVIAEPLIANIQKVGHDLNKSIAKLL